MKIDKIKVVYKLTSKLKNQGNNKNRSPWLFQEFLDRYTGSYTIIERVNLSPVQMRKINSWQDYYKFQNGDEESVLAFFVGRLKAQGDVDGSYCMLEFNPNKTTVPDVVTVFLYFRGAYVHRISSIDVAFDLKGVPIQDICFVGHGSISTMSIGTIGSSATRYLRPKCKDGRIKVYDKEKERQGYSDADSYKDITRVEITYQNVEFLLIDFLKDKIVDIDASDFDHIDDLFQREISDTYEDAFYSCYKRVSQMLKYLDSVRIFDRYKGGDASQFGLKQYQCDMFDAYVEKFGFQNLNILYNQMATHTRVKYRAYADYLSNTQMRPLFKGCANDYFFALRDLILKCVPFPRIDEDAVMRFHKFTDMDELPF